MDPKTNTREEFTQHLCSHEIPANASAEWRKHAEKLQSLLRKLASHEAMEANINQTYMTPAASKNKVYFMWDFVGRTLGFVYGVPPESTPNDAATKEQWTDIQTRCHMSADLILDQPPGMMDMMVHSVSPRDSDKDKAITFGDDIKTEAESLGLR